MTDTNIPEDTWAKLSKDGFNTPIHAPLPKTGSKQTENKKKGQSRGTPGGPWVGLQGGVCTVKQVIGAIIAV